MHDIIAYIFVGLTVAILISSLDDLLVDVMAFMARGRDKLSPRLRRKKPRIGIFIANWREADVLEKMVEGNLAALTYDPLQIYLGVYPNDDATKEVALELSRRHPKIVRVIVNTMNGPTSKGQLLNVMLGHVYGRGHGSPDLAVIHDSEDIIDPDSLDLYVTESERSDFIQIPVFSLDSRHRSYVAAHYMEEFAERHLGEMRVRSALGSIVPSAGVGTCLTRGVIRHFIRVRGAVFESGSVTEDYILGAEVHRAGFHSGFVCAPARDRSVKRFVATLEYFPRTFAASVRQKSRWVYGICFEGTRKLGWAGRARDKFFLYRDRKGAVTNLLPPVALTFGGAALVIDAVSAYTVVTSLSTVLKLNLAAAAARFLFKVNAVWRVYGIFDPIGVAIRWPVAIAVNCVATVRAWRSFLGESRLAARPISWVKTLHEIPEHFGQIAPARSEADHVRGSSTRPPTGTFIVP